MKPKPGGGMLRTLYVIDSVLGTPNRCTSGKRLADDLGWPNQSVYLALAHLLHVEYLVAALTPGGPPVTPKDWTYDRAYHWRLGAKGGVLIQEHVACIRSLVAHCKVHTP